MILVAARESTRASASFRLFGAFQPVRNGSQEKRSVTSIDDMKVYFCKS